MTSQSDFICQYEQKHKLANGAFSSVFCIKSKAKRSKVLYAAKYLKVPKQLADKEVGFLNVLNVKLNFFYAG